MAVNPEMNRIYLGDNLATMKTWPDACVQTCVTSPPYYGLRDYGTAPRIWGGDAAHSHTWEHHRYYVEGGGGAVGSAEAFSKAGPENAQRIKDARWREDDTCSCGAWRGNLGLEPTPELFIAHLVEIFREVGRVLKDDGTLWLNLGDSYNNYAGNRGAAAGFNKNAHECMPKIPSGRGLTVKGLKNKDLIGIPWMAAFALRADGWYLRSEIIWAKKNCMPESVTDRPTKAHEHIFLLTKSDRYFYDHVAIKEPVTESSIARVAQNDGNPVLNTDRKRGSTQNEQTLDIEKMVPTDGMRNKRSVWCVATQPFREAHFATFPPDLIAPCVLAGTPRGGVVLDPFMGAGTTALVAATHGRQFLGCELNPAYKEIAERRIANEVAQEKFL